MKLLTFQVRRFAWQTHSRTLDSAVEQFVDDAIHEAVVVFVHLEKRDTGEHRSRVFRHTLKHVKWIANKRSLRRVVLHSFTHLGGDTADAEFARTFLDELAARLRKTSYEVRQTPFGYFCSWSIDVYGDSLAKVFKEI